MRLSPVASTEECKTTPPLLHPFQPRLPPVLMQRQGVDSGQEEGVAAFG